MRNEKGERRRVKTENGNLKAFPFTLSPSLS